MSEKISDTKFDRLNHKAYLDVLDVNDPDPLLKYNETYMECYKAWRNLAGERHFDPHFDADIED